MLATCLIITIYGICETNDQGFWYFLEKIKQSECFSHQTKNPIGIQHIQNRITFVRGLIVLREGDEVPVILCNEGGSEGADFSVRDGKSWILGSLSVPSYQ